MYKRLGFEIVVLDEERQELFIIPFEGSHFH